MNHRVTIAVFALIAASLWIGLLSKLLSSGSYITAANLLLDLNTETFVYPFTIQNLMWLVFFVGAGELLVRTIAGRAESRQLDLKLLPEDAETILRREDVGQIYRDLRAIDPAAQFWLQRIITRVILAFQSTGSVAQVSEIFNVNMELCQHEIDLRYNLLRYLVWLIPTLGFIGTVVGIALALEDAGAAFANEGASADLGKFGPKLMQGLTGQLGIAFYTTLLALLQSAVLMFAMHVVQGHEETTINRIGQYCLDNLINRLYQRQP